MHSTEQDDDLAPWSFAEPWGGTGHVCDLDGPVHWVDFGGPADASPIVLVHGLGGSHLNWVLVASALAERLTNPDHKVAKTYLVKAATPLSDEQLAQLRTGVELKDGG